MKRYIPLLAFFPCLLMAQDVPEMVTRTYQLERSFILTKNAHESPGCFCNAHLEKVEITNRGVLQPELLHDISWETGVTFPEGSWLRQQSAGWLEMHNTERNHERFRWGLIMQHLLPAQIHFTFRILQFENKEIDRLDRKHPAGIPDGEIVALWQDGKGETIFRQEAKLINGVNTILETVDEVIYPTEYNITEDSFLDQDTFKPEYGGFETRNTGTILNVTATFSANGTLNLVLLPENVEQLDLSKKIPEHLTPLVPVFRSMNLTSSMMIQNGSTLVAAQSSSLDGKHQLYFLVSAGFIDTAGEPLRGVEKQTPEKRP